MQAAIAFLHALVGWALCAAVMWIGTSTISLDRALLVHLAAVPVIFGVVSFGYFSKSGGLSPRAVALLFVGVVVLMDLLVVAFLVVGSFEMFASPIGTWIPFVLIFLTTYAVGGKVQKPS